MGFRTVLHVPPLPPQNLGQSWVCLVCHHRNAYQATEIRGSFFYWGYGTTVLNPAVTSKSIANDFLTRIAPNCLQCMVAGHFFGNVSCHWFDGRNYRQGHSTIGDDFGGVFGSLMDQERCVLVQCWGRAGVFGNYTTVRRRWWSPIVPGVHVNTDPFETLTPTGFNVYELWAQQLFDTGMVLGLQNLRPAIFSHKHNQLIPIDGHRTNLRLHTFRKHRRNSLQQASWLLPGFVPAPDG